MKKHVRLQAKSLRWNDDEQDEDDEEDVPQTIAGSGELID